MKNFILSILCILILTSCDYKVAIVNKPNVKIDNEVVGLWLRENDNEIKEKLLILQLNKYEYFISYPSGDKTMFATGCLFKLNGKKFVQLKWFGTVEGKIQTNNHVYQYLKYRVNNDKLSIQLINTQIIDKNIKTSSELSMTIRKNINNSMLFNKPMIFEKVQKKTEENI
jgi:hypothetical protein